MNRVWISFCICAVLVAVPMFTSAQIYSAISSSANGEDGQLPFYLTGAYVTNLGTAEYFVENEPRMERFRAKSGRWACDYNAFQVGLGIPMDLGDMGSFVVGGTIAIPSAGLGEESLFEDRPYGQGSLRVARKWTADTYFATLEGMHVYPINDSWSTLAGFRWSYWQTSYRVPYDVDGNRTGTNQAVADTDTADMTVNAFIPLLGVMTDLGRLKAGFVGFPTVCGTAEHHEILGRGTQPNERATIYSDFSSGYFIEAFLDYTIPSLDLAGADISFSFFTKLNYLYAGHSSTFTLRRNNNPSIVDQDFVFYRSLLALGGKATLSFDTAGLINLVY